MAVGIANDAMPMMVMLQLSWNFLGFPRLHHQAVLLLLLLLEDFLLVTQLLLLAWISILFFFMHKFSKLIIPFPNF